MTPVLSNAPITRLLSSVQSAAKNDFGFFAMHVMGHRLDDEVCGVVQSAVDSKSDVILQVRNPRTLVKCLHAWVQYTRSDIRLDVPAELTWHPTETLPWVFGEAAEPEEIQAVLQVSFSDTYVSFSWCDDCDSRRTA